LIYLKIYKENGKIYEKKKRFQQIIELYNNYDGGRSGVVNGRALA
jgi:hypothetical protein